MMSEDSDTSNDSKITSKNDLLNVELGLRKEDKWNSTDMDTKMLKTYTLDRDPELPDFFGLPPEAEPGWKKQILNHYGQSVLISVITATFAYPVSSHT